MYLAILQWNWKPFYTIAVSSSFVFEMDKQVNDYFGFSCIKSMHILGIILTAECWGCSCFSIFIFILNFLAAVAVHMMKCLESAVLCTVGSPAHVMAWLSLSLFIFNTPAEEPKLKNTQL